MANVKCKNCGKNIDKKIAYKEEYITNTLKIANRYFCNSECYKKFHVDESIKSDFYSICSDILGAEMTKNVYFKKKIKDIEEKETMYFYVSKYKEKISEEFKNEIIKIEKIKKINLNYKISVLINMIFYKMNIYIKEGISENYTDDNEVLEDYIDYEKLMPKGVQVKPRKTIFDEGE